MATNLGRRKGMYTDGRPPEPTDEIEIGEILAFGSFRQREKPALGGSSVGHVNVTAGTLGCLVMLEDDSLCILSNNHVLANVNQASVGDKIVQPGKADGGTAA